MIDNGDFLSNLPFPDVAKALWSWLNIACPAIASENGHREICEDFFVQTDANRFEKKCRERTVYDPNVSRRWAAPNRITNIDAALAIDPDLGAVRNRYVGGAMDLFPVTAERLTFIVAPIDVDFENRRDLSIPDPVKLSEMLRKLKMVIAIRRRSK